jgi:hypothetical protein
MYELRSGGALLLGLGGALLQRLAIKKGPQNLKVGFLGSSLVLPCFSLAQLSLRSMLRKLISPHFVLRILSLRSVFARRFAPIELFIVTPLVSSLRILNTRCAHIKYLLVPSLRSVTMSCYALLLHRCAPLHLLSVGRASHSMYCSFATLIKYTVRSCIAALNNRLLISLRSILAYVFAVLIHVLVSRLTDSLRSSILASLNNVLIAALIHIVPCTVSLRSPVQD